MGLGAVTLVPLDAWLINPKAEPVDDKEISMAGDGAVAVCVPPDLSDKSSNMEETRLAEDAGAGTGAGSGGAGAGAATVAADLSIMSPNKSLLVAGAYGAGAAGAGGWAFKKSPSRLPLEGGGGGAAGAATMGTGAAAVPPATFNPPNNVDAPPAKGAAAAGSAGAASE